MRANEFITEADLGTSPKRAGRPGSRPARGHEPVNRYKKQMDTDCNTQEDIEISERGKASVKLCTSAVPDSRLGASQLSSCKSQGLRARDGEKSHKIGKTAKSRIKVGGKKIKGSKYGGPLPDWS